jgi:hypothetical protein
VVLRALESVYVRSASNDGAIQRVVLRALGRVYVCASASAHAFADAVELIKGGIPPVLSMKKFPLGRLGLLVDWVFHIRAAGR